MRCTFLFSMVSGWIIKHTPIVLRQASYRKQGGKAKVKISKIMYSRHCSKYTHALDFIYIYIHPFYFCWEYKAIILSVTFRRTWESFCWLFTSALSFWHPAKQSTCVPKTSAEGDSVKSYRLSTAFTSCLYYIKLSNGDSVQEMTKKTQTFQEPQSGPRGWHTAY